MLPPPRAEPALTAAPRAWRRRALLLLWPAFVMAGVLEALVFAVVDPAALHGLGTEPLRWSASAVHSISFLVFWAVIAMSAAVTLMLEAPGPGIAAARGV